MIGLLVILTKRQKGIRISIRRTRTRDMFPSDMPDMVEHVQSESLREEKLKHLGASLFPGNEATGEV